MSEEELTVTEEVDLEQLISENSHLKKKLGDQGNEIGQLRQATDQLLQQQAAQMVEDDDWYADPTEKQVKALEGKITQMEQQQAIRQLENKHPGFRDLPKDESFAAWVGVSKYRSLLYAKADQMDLEAADELFTAWEEQQEAASQNHQQANAERQKTLADASMEKGSAGGMRKQYFSRSELINLRITNPAKYDAMRDEIMAAYAEGRVRR